MERFRMLISWLLYGFLFVLLYAFQTAFAGRITLFGVPPDFLPLLVILTSFMEGGKTGAAFGLAAGILMGSGANLAVLYAFLYFPAGYLMGYLAVHHLRLHFFTALFFALLLSAIKVLMAWLCALLTGAIAPPAVLLYSAGAQALFTLMGSLLLYPILSQIRKLRHPSGYHPMRSLL